MNDKYIGRELDKEKRYIISLDKNYAVLFDDIYGDEPLINECAYVVGDIILPYFENKILGAVPGIYNNGNTEYDIVYPTDKTYYHISNAKSINERNIQDVLNEFGQKSSYEMFNNITGDEYHVPEHIDDQPLRLAFKKSLNRKKIIIDQYGNKFTASEMNNFKRRSKEHDLSIKMFSNWISKFNIGAKIICTDLDDPSKEPIEIVIN